MQKTLSSETTKTEHIHIMRKEGVCGRRPIIKGTRTPVRSIVGYYKMGMSVDEILSGLPHLKPAEVYAALAYYFDHKEEIERDIEEDSEENLMNQYPETVHKK